MDSNSKTLVRQGLIAAGFDRASYSTQFTSQGPYQEIWKSKDGSSVTIEWAGNAPKEPCANHFSDGSKIFPNRSCC